MFKTPLDREDAPFCQNDTSGCGLASLRSCLILTNCAPIEQTCKCSVPCGWPSMLELEGFVRQIVSAGISSTFESFFGRA
eukprot:305418-Amphidinium_carterae.1